MKSLILKSTMFLGAAVLMGLGAQAQVLRATVPFEFNANGKTMPAGDYIISTATQSGGVYVMKNPSERASVIVNSTGAIHEAANGPTKLVFDRALDGYYLTEMWDGSAGHALRCPRTRSAFVAGARIIIAAK
jgi:hypothetical protein